MMEPEAFDAPEPVAPPTYDIVHELTIAAPAAAVFDALTTAAQRSRWWPGTGGHELEAGQVDTVRVADEEIAVRVEVADRPEVIQWICVDGPREWVDTVISFRIEERLPGDPANPIGDARPAAIVRFWHGGWTYEDGLMPRVSFDWAMVLHRLRWHLESPAPADATATS